MKGRFLYYVVLTAALIEFSMVAMSVAAQDHAPVTEPDGEASAAPAVPTPHLADGHPDLNGLWIGGQGLNTVIRKKADGSIQVIVPTRGLPKSIDPDQIAARKNQDLDSIARRMADPNKPSYKPELVAKVQEMALNENHVDPAFFCKPAGLPRIGPPTQIVQTANQVVFLYQNENTFRQIPTDGRAHRGDLDPSFLGDSVAHWEGDTLVVDAIGFNDITWFSIDGYFHTEALHITERLQRVGDLLNYSITMDDPNVLTKPWTMNPRQLKLNTNSEDRIMEEPPCEERDEEHIVNHDHH